MMQLQNDNTDKKSKYCVIYMHIFTTVHFRKTSCSACKICIRRWLKMWLLPKTARQVSPVRTQRVASVTSFATNSRFRCSVHCVLVFWDWSETEEKLLKDEALQFMSGIKAFSPNHKPLSLVNWSVNRVIINCQRWDCVEGSLYGAGICWLNPVLLLTPYKGTCFVFWMNRSVSRLQLRSHTHKLEAVRDTQEFQFAANKKRSAMLTEPSVRQNDWNSVVWHKKEIDSHKQGKGTTEQP